MLEQATAIAMLYKDAQPASAYQPVAHDSNEETSADETWTSQCSGHHVIIPTNSSKHSYCVISMFFAI